MSIDWTKPLRVKGLGWPVEVISDRGRRPGYPMLCYVGDSTDTSSFSRDGHDSHGFYQLENVPEKLYAIYQGRYKVHVAAALTAREVIEYAGPTSVLSNEDRIYELTEVTLDKVKEEAK